MFDDLTSLADDADRLLDEAAKSLVAAGELHRLFDLRLMQERRRLGLALDRRTPIDEIEEPLRSELEAAYLAACREVGALFLEAGRLREAWTYLRPAGDKIALRERMARMRPSEDEVDGLIELALFEAVDPERGYAWLLGRRGTCNAITTLDGMAPQLSVAELRSCAAVLVRHVYQELQGNLRGHLNRLGGESTASISVGELITQHPELQSRGDYHLDASHLASTMRYARLLADRALITKALELAEYGSRLPADLQYPGEPPFEELYRANQLFLKAMLGQDVDAAVEYFASRIGIAGDGEGASPDASTVEAYLSLLVHAGRPADAMRAYGQLVPAGSELSRLAPTLLSLAELSGDWDQYDAICRERGDLVGYAAGLLRRADRQPG
jgi:hypothetical protein